MRREILDDARARALSRPSDRRGRRRADGVLHRGREHGEFDDGIEMARASDCSPIRSSSIASSTSLPSVAPGSTYRITDLELASRLSFFLWSSIPDDELLTLAEQGQLDDPRCSRSKCAGCSRDPRSEALTANFAGQWLNLRALEGHVPVVDAVPGFRRQPAPGFPARDRAAVRQHRARGPQHHWTCSTADYTFVNERLAKHYGIPGIYGSQFRRVTLGPELDARRGLLGKGSLLTVSSQPGRTSPVSAATGCCRTFSACRRRRRRRTCPISPTNEGRGRQRANALDARADGAHRATPRARAATRSWTRSASRSSSSTRSARGGRGRRRADRRERA